MVSLGSIVTQIFSLNEFYSRGNPIPTHT